MGSRRDTHDDVLPLVFLLPLVLIAFLRYIRLSSRSLLEGPIVFRPTRCVVPAVVSCRRPSSSPVSMADPCDIGAGLFKAGPSQPATSLTCPMLQALAHPPPVVAYLGHPYSTHPCRLPLGVFSCLASTIRLL